jgi:hypothetical protein
VAEAEATIDGRESREPAADEEMPMVMSEEHPMVPYYSMMSQR